MPGHRRLARTALHSPCDGLCGSSTSDPRKGSSSGPGQPGLSLGHGDAHLPLHRYRGVHGPAQGPGRPAPMREVLSEHHAMIRSCPRLPRRQGDKYPGRRLFRRVLLGQCLRRCLYRDATRLCRPWVAGGYPGPRAHGGPLRRGVGDHHDRPGRLRHPPGRPGCRRSPWWAGPVVGGGGQRGAGLAPSRGNAARPRPAPVEGPGPPGTDFPAPG